MSSDDQKHPFASPSTEYSQFKGFNNVRQIDSETNVSNQDILVAILRSADAIFHELKQIRIALEERPL